MPTLTNTQSESDTAHAKQAPDQVNDHPAVSDEPEEIATPAAILELSRYIGADVPKLDFRHGIYTRRRTDAPYSPLTLPRAAAPTDQAQPESGTDAKTTRLDLTRHIDLSV